MRILLSLLVLQLFTALGCASPMPREGSKKQSSSTPSQPPRGGSQTTLPSFPPSHWVNPYKNCNAEKTEMVDNWIMDVFNMTFKAERNMKRDHPAFTNYFFVEDYPAFKEMIRAFNGGKPVYNNFQCVENGQQQCPTPGRRFGTNSLTHFVYLCSNIFGSTFAEVTLPSKPFDSSENGWCQPPPHYLGAYISNTRSLLSRMIYIRLPQNRSYRESYVSEGTAARNLKSKFTTLLNSWEQLNPRQQGPRPISPLENAESYAASIIEFFFMRKCGKNLDPDQLG